MLVKIILRYVRPYIIIGSSWEDSLETRVLKRRKIVD